jgi:hypothetical protein
MYRWITTKLDNELYTSGKVTPTSLQKKRKLIESRASWFKISKLEYKLVIPKIDRSMTETTMDVICKNNL